MTVYFLAPARLSWLECLRRYIPAGMTNPSPKDFALSRFLPVWYSGCLGLLGMRAMLKLFASNILAGAGAARVRGGHCRLCEWCRMRNGCRIGLVAQGGLGGGRGWIGRSFSAWLVARAVWRFGAAADFLVVAEPFVSLAFLVSVSGGDDGFSDVRESVGGCGSAWAVWLECSESVSFLVIHMKNNVVTTTMSNPAAVAAPAAIQIRVRSGPCSGLSADLPRFGDPEALGPALSRVLNISLAAAAWSGRGRVRSMIVPEPARDGGLA